MDSLDEPMVNEMSNKKIIKTLKELKAVFKPYSKYYFALGHAIRLFEQEEISTCNHEWVSADNEVVRGGELCLKCNAVRESD